MPCGANMGRRYTIASWLMQALALLCLVSVCINAAADTASRTPQRLAVLQHQVVALSSVAVLEPAKVLALQQQGLEIWAQASNAMQRQLTLQTLAQFGLLPGLQIPRVTPPAMSFAQLQKPTVVHFWAHWCAPCRHELPELVQFYQQRFFDLNSSGLQVVAVNNDPQHPSESALVDLQGVPEQHDPNFVWYRALAKQQAVALPATFLVMPDGQVTALAFGRLDWLSADLPARFRQVVRQMRSKSRHTLLNAVSAMGQ